MLTAIVFAILALALWFPETRLGGGLRRLLIDRPARILNGLRRGHILLGLVIFAALAVAYAVAREAGVLVAGQAAADGVAIALALDLATWLDLMAIALVLAVTMRSRAVFRMVAAQVAQWSGRWARMLTSALARCKRRVRRIRSAPRPGPGEDSDRPATAFAWA